ncbi:hypothetical protein PLIIFM63780_006535 [Purpureocillium lilacinum]|nr:hypothetical protein PLIIFM63780_006535 [Purpureocillium lilacinum]
MAPVQLPDVSTVTAVDLARLIERDDAETTRLVEALESPGYFYLDLRNAPATKAIADQARLMYALSENYFEQPAEIKAEDFRQGQPSWSDRGDELRHKSLPLPISMIKQADLIESFHGHCHEAARVVLARLVDALDTPLLENVHRDSEPSETGLKLISEPSVPLAANVLENKHRDSGTLTMLFYDSWSMQVCLTGDNNDNDEQGRREWVFVPPPPEGCALHGIDSRHPAFQALSRALATLGYGNLYDLDTVANGSPEHAAFWVRAIERKLSGQPGFDGTEAAAFFDGYDGVRNVPAAAFAAEFIESYPTSKVILPTRDVDSWHASCLGTVYQRAVDPILGALALIHSGSRTYATLLRALQRALYRGDFPGYGKTAFAEHQDYVRGRVPAERLLEYRVQQGWGPLCEFLGEPVPAGDFPQSNDRDAFWEGCRARDRRVLRELAVKALLVSGTAVVVAWLLRGVVLGPAIYNPIARLAQAFPGRPEMAC